MDETAPAQTPEQMKSELEESRAASARLLDSLARKVRMNKAYRGTAGGIERAARYIRGDAVRNAAAGLNRLVRERPVYSIGAAAVAGFLIGRVLRSR